MALKVGALFAGYGGIELALSSVLDTEPAWFAEFDKAPSKILAHHWPDVPNFGDVTKVDWANVEPVDIITGGSPCQDLSHAGKRKGMTDGTRSNLWAEMREAIAVIRPRLVAWENVRGAASAHADSDMEQCPRCVGGAGDGKPVLRALGRVVGDLADLRYVGRIYGLRAADVGAAHGRFRYFLFATPADAGSLGWGEGEGHRAGPGTAPREGQAGGTGGHSLLGVDAPHVPGQLTLLPTPAVNDMGAAYTPETWDAWTTRMKAAHGNGNGHGKSLAIEAQRLLPTPRTSDTNGAGAHGTGGIDLRTAAARLLPTPNAADAVGGRHNSKGHQSTLPGTVRLHAQDWREYEAAIRRQEAAFGRPAPLPTETGPKGNPRLSPAFVEWLMGLPAGWVTDVPGISRNDQLKALGNGVVWQQCAAALRAFLHDTRQENVA